MEKIKEFIYPDNPRLSTAENVRIKNRSNHNKDIHHAFFNVIDEFSKRVIKDLYNHYNAELFQANNLNVIADEKSLEDLMTNQLAGLGHMGAKLSNPEMIYRAFNFIKPDNLLPGLNFKLYLIKQVGISETGNQVTYLINPHFFGFLLSFHIYINSLFCDQYDSSIEDGLVKILSDKYGEEYSHIYEYVGSVGSEYALKGKRNQDKKDETFIAGVQTISGIEDRELFYNFIYEPAMYIATENAKALSEF